MRRRMRAARKSSPAVAGSRGGLAGRSRSGPGVPAGPPEPRAGGQEGWYGGGNDGGGVLRVLVTGRSLRTLASAAASYESIRVMPCVTVGLGRRQPAAPPRFIIVETDATERWRLLRRTGRALLGQAASHTDRRSAPRRHARRYSRPPWRRRRARGRPSAKAQADRRAPPAAPDHSPAPGSAAAPSAAHPG